MFKLKEGENVKNYFLVFSFVLCIFLCPVIHRCMLLTYFSIDMNIKKGSKSIAFSHPQTKWNFLRKRQRKDESFKKRSTSFWNHPTIMTPEIKLLGQYFAEIQLLLDILPGKDSFLYHLVFFLFTFF